MSNTVKWLRVGLVILFLVASHPLSFQAKSLPDTKRANKWRAVHLLDYDTDADLEALGPNLKKLANMGINTLILEVDYNFAFKSHPELRRGTNPITREGARNFAATCRKLGIRLIPEFQSLGHQ